jgi:mannosyltransferase
MQKAKKVYGYVMALWELGNTVPSLFSHVSKFKLDHNIPSSDLWKSFIDPSWAPLPFRQLLSLLPGRDMNGNAWNYCHYWSNFEIADMDWFRSPAYRELFQRLDEAGGIYYERVCTTHVYLDTEHELI